MCIRDRSSKVRRCMAMFPNAASIICVQITSTANNVYSTQQTQPTAQQPASQTAQPQPPQQPSQTQQQVPVQQQQQPQQPQQQSQISSGVTYTTNNTSTSFSVYSSNNHSVATATRRLYTIPYITIVRTNHTQRLRPAFSRTCRILVQSSNLIR